MTPFSRNRILLFCIILLGLLIPAEARAQQGGIGERKQRLSTATDDTARMTCLKTLDTLKRRHQEARKSGDQCNIAAILGNMGRVYASMREYTIALEYFRSSLELYSAIHFPGGLAIIHGYLGSVYHDRREYENAKNHYLQSLKWYADLNDSAGTADVEQRLGDICGRQGRYGDAKKYLASARDRYAFLGDRIHAAKTGTLLAHALEATGNPDSALILLKEALRVAEQTHDAVWQASIEHELASLYYNQHRNEKAIHHATRSQELYASMKRDEGVAGALEVQGAVFRQMGEYGKAERLLASAIRLYDSLGSRQLMPLAYLNLGGVYKELGRYGDALHCFREGQIIAQEMSLDEAKRTILFAMGNIHLNLKHYDSALAIFQQTLKLGEKAQHASLISSSLCNMGHCYQFKGDYPKALELYMRCVEFCREKSRRKHLINAQSSIGQIYLKMGSYKEAFEHFQHTHDLYMQWGYQRERVLSLHGMVYALMHTQSYDDALHLLETAREICLTMEMNRELVETEELFGSVYSKMKRYVESTQHLREALEKAKQINDRSLQASIGGLLGQNLYVQGDYNGALKVLTHALHLADSLHGLSSAGILQKLEKTATAMGDFERAYFCTKRLTALLDSTRGAEVQKQFNELRAKYEADERERKIELLEKENRLSALELSHQQEVLLRQQLEANQRTQAYTLLSREHEIQDLELHLTQAQLQQQKVAGREQKQRLVVADKERQLQTQALQRETMLRNILFGSSIAILLIAVISIMALRARRRASDARAAAAEEKNRRQEIERKQADYEARKRFTRKLIDSQEQERKRIAADLHDSIAQDLLIINNRVRLTARRAGVDTETADELNRISEVVTGSMHELRDISRALRPFHLDRIGLTTTIEAMLETVNEASDTPFEWDIIQMAGWFTKGQEINIYRIVQEAVNNIIKHSGAKHAWVSLKRRNGDLHVEIRDDGRGFDVERKAHGSSEPAGFGLQGMYERVDILGGNLNIRSGSGEGTTVEIFIPISAPDIKNERPVHEDALDRRPDV
ncbi:MAG: tetratricopeptide repeat protein [Bacteroidetes bacterium]|nr:tetratricopeptide repeat protein [Bacteroidota bacterium]